MAGAMPSSSRPAVRRTAARQLVCGAARCIFLSRHRLSLVEMIASYLCWVLRPSQSPSRRCGSILNHSSTALVGGDAVAILRRGGVRARSEMVFATTSINSPSLHTRVRREVSCVKQIPVFVGGLVSVRLPCSTRGDKSETFMVFEAVVSRVSLVPHGSTHANHWDLRSFGRSILRFLLLGTPEPCQVGICGGLSIQGGRAGSGLLPPGANDRALQRWTLCFAPLASRA